MEERRGCARWVINKQASLKLHEDEHSYACDVEDISLRGARIHSSQKINKNTNIGINIPLDDEFFINDLEAEVVWSQSLENDNIYGLHFTKIKELDKEIVYNFIKKHFFKELQRHWWEGCA